MTIEFISADTVDKKAPKSAPKATPDTGTQTLSEIGRQAEEQLPGRDAKNIYLNTLGQELRDNLPKLSPATQKRLLNPDGSINQNEVARIYGLSSPKFQRHITPDGKIKPATEVPEEDDDKAESGTVKIPERDPRSKTGSELFREWGLNRDMNGFQPELTRRIIAEIEKGNVPDSCRNMSTVNMTDPNNPRGPQLSFRTSNGFLAVGSNKDNIMVPLSGPMAKEIADHFGWVLPTADMAEARDYQSQVKLKVGGLQDISRMADLEWARRHDVQNKQKLQEWLTEYNATHKPPLTEADLSKRLVGGGKKYVFIGRGATIDGGGVGITGLLMDGVNPRTGKPFIQDTGYPHPYNIEGKSGGHGDYSQCDPIVDPQITIREAGRPIKTVHLYDILRAPPPPEGAPPTDPEGLARYNQAVDYARYRKILNSYENGAAFNPDQAYTAHQKNSSNQDRIARNRRTNKNQAAS